MKNTNEKYNSVHIWRHGISLLSQLSSGAAGHTFNFWMPFFCRVVNNRSGVDTIVQSILAYKSTVGLAVQYAVHIPKTVSQAPH